jgi:hypothetical protein
LEVSIMKYLAIVGSRGYERLELVKALVARLRPSTVVVSGGARGVDRTAQATAFQRGLQVKVFPPDWQRFGKSAGFKRNEQIVKQADGMVAFWDGQSKGTAHSIQLARKKRIWLRVYGPDGQIIPLCHWCEEHHHGGPENCK